MSARTGLARTALAALAAATVLGGCVTLPTSGPVPGVSALPGSGGSAQQGVQLTPMGPGASWSQQQIVDGFLAASGTSQAVARQYLDTAYKKTWRPSRFPTVIDADPLVGLVKPAAPARVIGAESAVVNVSSSQVEQMLPNYTIVTEPGTHTYSFDLDLVNGQWRIRKIIADGKASPGLLLITRPDFEFGYPARILFYPACEQPTPCSASTTEANSASHVLIPDLRYIKQQPGSQGVATLVGNLIAAPSRWLAGVAVTAFPRGTTFKVQVRGTQAVVELGGAAARASRLVRQQMGAQLVWSLTGMLDPTLPGTGISSVELQVGGTSTLLLPGNRKLLSWVPRGLDGPVYFQIVSGEGGSQVERYVMGERPQPVQLPNGMGRGAFTAIAVNAPVDQSSGYTLAGCRGKDVYVAVPLDRKPISQALSSACTSMSWDDQGDLWLAAGSAIYVLPLEGSVATARPQVTPLRIVESLPGDIGALQVAPDGERVAMIVRTRTGATVSVAAISASGPQLSLTPPGQMVTVGSGIAYPTAVSWWDPDHLLVLDQPPHGRAQLYAVPLNGGASAQVSTPAGTVAIASSGGNVVVSTADGRILIWRGRLSGAPYRLGLGATPVFPGGS